MKLAGLIPLKNNLCVFVSKLDSLNCIVGLYIDDLLITGHSEEEIALVHVTLKRFFVVTDLGEVSDFLGINIMRSNTKVRLS